MCIGPEVVEALGQEACHVDGVGRGELHVLVEFSIHEGVLYHCLAIVEDAVHLDGGDVLSEGGELAFLDGRYLALGIEHIDVDALYAKEAVGNGRTGVARGGNEDIDEALTSLLLVEIAQKACHKACADILEGEGGTME